MTSNSTPDVSRLQAGLSALPLRREAEFAADANGIGAFQILTAVLLIALFIGIVIWRRRRAGLAASRQWRQWLKPPIESGSVRLMQSTRLTPAASVHVLRWNGQEWLLGCTEHGISVIGQRVQPAGAADGGRNGKAGA